MTTPRDLLQIDGDTLLKLAEALGSGEMKPDDALDAMKKAVSTLDLHVSRLTDDESEPDEAPRSTESDVAGSEPRSLDEARAMFRGGDDA